MAGPKAVLKIAKQVVKKFKKPGYKKYNPKSKRIGVNRAREEKLYTTIGKDRHGDINIINEGRMKGIRMPLDTPKYKDRRPWIGKDSGHITGDVDPKNPYRERFDLSNRRKGQSGGLVTKGKPRLAKKGWK
jgi:hypothetical protein